MKRKDIVVAVAGLGVSAIILGSSFNTLKETEASIIDSAKDINDTTKKFILSQEYIGKINEEHAKIFDKYSEGKLSSDTMQEKYEEVLSFEHAGELLASSTSEEMKDDREKYMSAKEKFDDAEKKIKESEILTGVGSTAFGVSALYLLFESITAIKNKLTKKKEKEDTNSGDKNNQQEDKKYVDSDMKNLNEEFSSDERIEYMLSPIKYSKFSKKEDKSNGRRESKREEFYRDFDSKDPQDDIKYLLSEDEYTQQEKNFDAEKIERTSLSSSYKDKEREEKLEIMEEEKDL